jgi:hypothetical protein
MKTYLKIKKQKQKGLEHGSSTEHSPYKLKALSSNHSTTKQTKKHKKTRSVKVSHDSPLLNAHLPIMAKVAS